MKLLKSVTTTKVGGKEPVSGIPVGVVIFTVEPLTPRQVSGNATTRESAAIEGKGDVLTGGSSEFQ